MSDILLTDDEQEVLRRINDDAIKTAIGAMITFSEKLQEIDRQHRDAMFAEYMAQFAGDAPKGAGEYGN